MKHPKASMLPLRAFTRPPSPHRTDAAPTTKSPSSIVVHPSSISPTHSRPINHRPTTFTVRIWKDLWAWKCAFSIVGEKRSMKLPISTAVGTVTTRETLRLKVCMCVWLNWWEIMGFDRSIKPTFHWFDSDSGIFYTDYPRVTHFCVGIPLFVLGICKHHEITHSEFTVLFGNHSFVTSPNQIRIKSTGILRCWQIRRSTENVRKGLGKRQIHHGIVVHQSHLWIRNVFVTQVQKGRCRLFQGSHEKRC